MQTLIKGLGYFTLVNIFTPCFANNINQDSPSMTIPLQVLLESRGRNNMIQLMQIGNDNNTNIAQQGNNHDANVVQMGIKNNAQIKQFGANNQVISNQVGIKNEAEITQVGDDNLIMLNQMGSHQFSIMQYADGGTIIITQY